MRVEAKEQIKLMTSRRGLLLKDVAQKMTEKTGKPYTPQSFAAKLRRGSLSYNEFLTICELLDYEIEIKDKLG